MVTTPTKPRSGCPINFGLEIFGDRWSLLILRDVVLHGKRTFKQFKESGEGIATNILSTRLRRLEQCGLLAKRPSTGDRRQVEYWPTEPARRLVPVLVEMAYWGATHDPETAAPASFVDAYRQDRDGLLAGMIAGDVEVA